MVRNKLHYADGIMVAFLIFMTGTPFFITIYLLPYIPISWTIAVWYVWQRRKGEM